VTQHMHIAIGEHVSLERPRGPAARSQVQLVFSKLCQAASAWQGINRLPSARAFLFFLPIYDA
jgi:hypothetical protein